MRTGLWSYSRVVPSADPAGWPGPLALVWGTSTDREDGKPPRDDGSEERGPRVRVQAKRGLADDVLDARIKSYVNATAALVEMAHALEVLANRENGTVAMLKSPRARVVRRGQRAANAAELRTVLLDHIAEVEGAEAKREKFPSHEMPWWHQHIALASLGVLASLYEVVTNEIKARGVEWMGTLDRVAPRVEREEPFASVRHACSVAFSAGDGAQLGGRSPRIGGAQAKHALPQGLVFGKMAVQPSHTGTDRAPGEDAVIEGVDVWAAIRRARVGRGSRERPLDEIDLALLALVDRGAEKARASRGKGGAVSAAFEPLRVDEAVDVMREHGVVLTVREAKLRIRDARAAIEAVLHAHQYIPKPREAKPRARTPHAPSFDPFQIGVTP